MILTSKHEVRNHHKWSERVAASFLQNGEYVVVADVVDTCRSIAAMILCTRVFTTEVEDTISIRHSTRTEEGLFY